MRSRTNIDKSYQNDAGKNTSNLSFNRRRARSGRSFQIR